jgi:YHS domain-containing protein
MTKLHLLLSLSLFALAIVVSGCSHQAAKEPNPSTSAASPDVSTGLAELSVEDCELAKKQRVCPVSGELLGAMGKPFKTEVKGKTVFLCCQGCEDDLKQNPDKYLAKLKDAEEKK